MSRGWLYFGSRKWFWLQLTLIVSVAIIAVLLHVLGTFASFDQWDWDFAVRHQVRLPVSSIIIISADGNEWPIEEENLREIHLKLSTTKPAAIVYTFHIPISFQKHIAESEVPTAYPSNSVLIPEKLSSFSVQLRSPTGVAFPTPSTDGIHRKQQLIFHTDRGFEASLPLAALVAAKVADPVVKIRSGWLNTGKINIPVDPSQTVDISFLGSSQSYPHIPLTKILNDEFPLDLLTNKILFVGPTKPSTSRMLLTPVDSSGQPISETEYWAEVTGTLIEGRAKRSISTYYFVIIVFSFIVVSGLIFRLVNPLVGIGILSILLPSTWLFNSIALDRFDLQIPFTSLRVGLVLCLISLTLARILMLHISLSRLLLRLKLRERGALALIGEPTEYNLWEKAADAVSYYLDIESQIFFEKLPHKKHLQIAFLRGVTTSEIVEKRRDCTRAPYTTALGSPIFVQRFLSGDRTVMMVPLAFGRRIFGYWVIARQGDQKYFNEKRELISLLAKELSISFLYYQGITKKPRRLFNLLLEEIFLRLSAVENLTEELIRERELLSSVLNSQSDGVAACDTLGRVLVYNSVLVKVLSALKIDLNINNLFETICLLAKMDVATLRAALYRAIFNEKELILNLEIDKDKSYRLIVHAVLNTSETESIRGFVLTLVNIGEYKEFDSMKSQFIDNIFGITQNYLTPIIGYGELLQDSNTISEEDRGMVSIIVDRAKQLADIFHKASSITEINLQDLVSGRVPVNIVQLLNNAIEKVRYNARQREITIDFNYPVVINNILCSKDEISDSLVSILSFLINLMPPGSNLLVELVDRQNDVNINFQVQGFNLPSKIIEGVVKGTGLIDKRIAQARRVFLSHDGIFELKSSLEKGTIIEVTLPSTWSRE